MRYLLTVMITLAYFHLSALQAMANEANNFRRHFLIFYDNSYPFYALEKKTSKIKKTLIDLFSNKIPTTVKGEHYSLRSEQ